MEKAGWTYTAGNALHRASRHEVLLEADFKEFLKENAPDLTAGEIDQLYDTVHLAGGESDFATLHKLYGWMVFGIQFVPQNGLARMVPLINFEEPGKNIFRAVNQFVVEYTNNGQKETRRPDVLLFVNGMPLCIIELKTQLPPMRPFTMLGSRSPFATGGTSPICCTTAPLPASPMVSRPALVRCVPLMSISTHGGVWRMATRSLRCLLRKPKL